jgi:hypothetical protein
MGTPEKKPRRYVGGMALCIDDSLPYTAQAGGEVHVRAIEGNLLPTGRC